MLLSDGFVSSNTELFLCVCRMGLGDGSNLYATLLANDIPLE